MNTRHALQPEAGSGLERKSSLICSASRVGTIQDPVCSEMSTFHVLDARQIPTINKCTHDYAQPHPGKIERTAADTTSKATMHFGPRGTEPRKTTQKMAACMEYPY